MILHRATDIKVWRQEVKAKTCEYCRICGRPGHDPHHIATRHHEFFKLIVENGIWVCRKCHIWIGKDRKKADEIIKSIAGDELWDILQNRDIKNLNTIIIRKVS
ncbi:MAG: hypothetical protein KGY74_10235 [Candidatus Cloacimonetes bacterium]|nr:hypothetical protein [Candidatus Cloacimonadota bacterium]